MDETLAAPFAIGPVTLRNRLVATAHASGLVQMGCPWQATPSTGDAWRPAAQPC
jgi:hypothetical protein